MESKTKDKKKHNDRSKRVFVILPHSPGYNKIKKFTLKQSQADLMTVNDGIDNGLHYRLTVCLRVHPKRNERKKS